MQNIQATILSFAPCADQTVEKVKMPHKQLGLLDSFAHRQGRLVVAGRRVRDSFLGSRCVLSSAILDAQLKPICSGHPEANLISDTVSGAPASAFLFFLCSRSVSFSSLSFSFSIVLSVCLSLLSSFLFSYHRLGWFGVGGSHNCMRSASCSGFVGCEIFLRPFCVEAIASRVWEGSFCPTQPTLCDERVRCSGLEG